VLALTIQCIFDEEFGPGGMDPLGRLVISNGESEIAIEPTYFDSWLTALIDALPQLSTAGHVSVAVPEEPKPLEIDVSSDGHLVISYKDQKTAAQGRKEFEFALRSAVGSFLAALRNSSEASQNRGIDPIRRFWATTQN
jgi:hypothetical protein